MVINDEDKRGTVTLENVKISGAKPFENLACVKSSDRKIVSRLEILISDNNVKSSTTIKVVKKEHSKEEIFSPETVIYVAVIIYQEKC